MKNYTNYEPEDFVQDPYFRKWVLDELAPEDNFWPAWQKAHPQQYDAIEQARQLVIAFQCDNPVNDPEEIKRAIDGILRDSKLYRLRVFYKDWGWKIAASLVLVTGLCFWYLTSNVTTDRESIAYAGVEVNEGTAPRSFRLSDSTMVTLFPNSQLRIGTSFGKVSREVFLTGEAFFHVARNAEKPFYVYAGEVVTKVLGTSFKVKAFASDANVSVAVSTGKVTVFKQKSAGLKAPALSEEIILVPNQQAVFEKTGERLIKTLVENPVVLNPEEHDDVLDFSETPIPQVLHHMERAYGVKIVFDEQLLENCNFTARLTNEPLYEKLNMVCETIQARYEIVDGQVVIYAKKCQ